MTEKDYIQILTDVLLKFYPLEFKTGGKLSFLGKEFKIDESNLKEIFDKLDKNISSENLIFFSGNYFENLIQIPSTKIRDRFVNPLFRQNEPIKISDAKNGVSYELSILSEVVDDSDSDLSRVANSSILKVIASLALLSLVNSLLDKVIIFFRLSNSLKTLA